MLIQHSAHGLHKIFRTPKDWNDIWTAPRDGTVIELRNDYGIAPWYGLYRWSREDSTWVKVADENHFVEDGPHVSWRPYEGDAATYVDPTGGAQETPEYWQRAIDRL